MNTAGNRQQATGNRQQATGNRQQRQRRVERIQDYRDLVAWKKARELVKAVYEATAVLPKEERFGLVGQMRRAAVSIPSNVAEGYGRGAKKDYLRFLRMARGSLYEIQTQITLAEDLGNLSADSAKHLFSRVTECLRVLHGLMVGVAAAGSPRPRRPKSGP